MCKSKTTRAGWVDKKAEKLKKIREEEAKTETESEVDSPKTETEPETDNESANPEKASSSSLQFGKAKRINEIDTADLKAIEDTVDRETIVDTADQGRTVNTVDQAPTTDTADQETIVVKTNKSDEEKVTPEVIYKLNGDTEKLEVRGKSVFLDLVINEKSVEVELDTGSPISIMNEELLQQISDDNTEINNDPGPRCFTDFNNKVVRIEKTAKLKTQFKRTRRYVKWWIVKHECKPIIGTDYMEKLGM